MQKSKYVGKVVDGYWEVIDYEERKKGSMYYTLQNQYNKRTIEIELRTLKNIMQGRSSVAFHIRKQIPKERRFKF